MHRRRAHSLPRVKPRTAVSTLRASSGSPAARANDPADHRRKRTDGLTLCLAAARAVVMPLEPRQVGPHIVVQRASRGAVGSSKFGAACGSHTAAFRMLAVHG